MLTPRSEETPWFADIRTLALIACITTVALLVVPLWNAGLQFLAILQRNPAGTWVAALGLILIALVTGTLLRFYFVLYRHGGSLRFTKPLRLLSLAGALLTGMLLLTRLKDSFAFLSAEAASPLANADYILGICSQLSYIFLLVAFFRRGTDESSTEVRVERQLRIASRVVLVGWGLWVILALVRAVFVPLFVSPQLQDIATQSGRIAPPLTDLLAEPIRNVLDAGCLLVAPYVVHRSDRRSVFLDRVLPEVPDEPVES